MKWAADKVVRRKVSLLVPYARNARTHSKEQVDQIAASIEQWGWTVPVLIDPENGIIAGHGRILAAEKLGLAEVPCMVAVGWTEEQKRAYILADNKLALNAGWDETALASELSDLQGFGFDLGLMGFSDQEVAELLQDEVHEDGLTGDDEVPEVGERPISKMGDIWILGEHRVMCGDSRSPDYVARLVGQGLVDAIWTDPPYNVAYKGTAGTIKNDDMGDGEFRVFLREAFTAGFLMARAGAPIYVAHADTEGLNFRAAFIEAGFKISGCLVWVKPSLVLGRSDYQWRHEPILYGWKPGAAHSWYGGRKQTTVIEAQDAPVVVQPDGSVTFQSAGQTFRVSGADLKVEAFEGSVFRVEKPGKSAEHPTMKPVELVVSMLRNSTKRGDVVLDLFGGSGSTLIAAHKMGRSARLMEFDEKFCDVIVRRWQNFTGREAVLEGSKKTFGALERARPKNAA